MPTPDTSLETRALSLEEYRSLRRTVQQRGTIRIVVALATWSVWAALAFAGWTNGLPPMAGLLSLIVLFGGFELMLSLHTGVERIGRYLQIAYETGLTSPPAWEHVAMGMGGRWLSPGGLDPLFSGVFLTAALVNALPAVAGGSMTEVAAAVVVHIAFGLRVLIARRFV
jgi:hypothetical protein